MRVVKTKTPYRMLMLFKLIRGSQCSKYSEVKYPFSKLQFYLATLFFKTHVFNSNFLMRREHLQVLLSIISGVCFPVGGKAVLPSTPKSQFLKSSPIRFKLHSPGDQQQLNTDVLFLLIFIYFVLG